jgi:hypothetical protein
MTRIDLGSVRLTRVLYLDAAIDPEPTGLTPAEVRAVRWAEPVWAEGDQVRAAACVWVIEADGRVIVVDPAGNVDEILHDPATMQAHQDAFAAAFAAAGVPIDRVDTVLLSHIESVGMTAVRDDTAPGGWRPFFPNARVVISDSARRGFDVEPGAPLVADAFSALIANDHVDTFVDGDVVAPGVVAEWTGAHNPGHCAFHVGDGPAVTFVGHLAVTPLHLATGPCEPQHFDPVLAWTHLQRFAADGRILIGPLWPSPGAGRWNGAELVGVDTGAAS